MHEILHPQEEFAIKESIQIETTRQLILKQRSVYISQTCSRLHCSTKIIPEHGSCIIDSTLVQLGRKHSPSTINKYRFQLINFEMRNPELFYDLDCVGGPLLHEDIKANILSQHWANITIPGTMLNEIDFKAIAAFEIAIVTVHIIIVSTGKELTKVYLPSPGEKPQIRQIKRAETIKTTSTMNYLENNEHNEHHARCT